ncbi:PREDICTED: chromogranin-A isoform X2 [Propithecus coquereli]|uniref:chromogranin-A isoform X2 n=1 Tax=Propithecus coquereli TaxID=379532 RepID=UPI00063EDE82|nr:PREDICTED: chromogranin-A isoform X2 [Propithecus coquereli]
MRSAAVLALLLCAGQVTALPVNSPLNKGDTEVMKCIVEVISDTLSKPSPMPVSQECFETLAGSEHDAPHLQRENWRPLPSQTDVPGLGQMGLLPPVPIPGAKERAQQQKKHSSFEDELSEVLENQSTQAELKGRSEALAVDAARKPGAEEARPLRGKGEQEHSRQQEEEEEEEEMAGAPRGLFRGGKSGQLEREQEERLSKQWEDAKRWSKMDQLAKELTAEKRLEREEEEDSPDRSMKLSSQARGYGFRGPGPQLRRGWRPSSREDSVEAGLPLQVHGYPEEKKEEEGSANRRPEDQELESLSAIEAELEKVARELQALRRG